MNDSNERYVTLLSGETLALSSLPRDRDPAELNGIDFPRDPDDSPRSCPIDVSAVYDYAICEGSMVGAIDEEDLVFQRSVVINETTFWVWKLETDTGNEYYYAAKGDDFSDSVGMLLSIGDASIPVQCLLEYARENG